MLVPACQRSGRSLLLSAMKKQANKFEQSRLVQNAADWPAYAVSRANENGKKGLSHFRQDNTGAPGVCGGRLDSAGNRPPNTSKSSSVRPIDLGKSMVKVETQMPVAREINRVLPSASAVRQNSSRVTPPSINGSAKIGKSAIKA